MATAFQSADVADQDMTREEWFEKIQSAASGIVQDMEKLAHEQVSARGSIEMRWLEDLRRYHGKYDVETEAILNDPDEERSKVFINITRPKTTAWTARLSDMLFPNDDKNWGINQTPVPELTEEARIAAQEAEEQEKQAADLAEESNQMVDQGAPEDQRQAKIAQAQQLGAAAQANKQREREVQATFQQAKKRAEAMQREIDDQLTESKYPARSRDVLEDACKLGVGILKGPITASQPRRKWEKIASDTGASIFALNAKPDPRPEARRVDPWNFFPDMNATSMEDCEFTFERHTPNAKQLRRMAKTLGFHAGTVRQILKDGPGQTDFSDLNYITQLRTIEGNTSNNAVSNKFIVWEYHGPLEIEQIASLMRGMSKLEEADAYEADADPLDERMVILYFCNGLLLKISEEYPLDSLESMYSVFSFEKAEASILGAVGVPWLMRHEQSMLNSAVRMMMDNGALSIGPQIVIDKTQVEPENGKWKLTARKVWKKKGQEIAANQEPFRTYNIPMNQAQLAGIIELALKFIDEVISMPMIAQGEQGSHVTQTANGMSMLFNSANVVFRRVVKNWDDDLTTPTIRRFYDWNMQFNDKDAIKGDMQIEARGTSVLLVREVQSQQLMVITAQWSTHPVIGPAIKVYDALRMTLQALSLNPDEVLVTPDEFEKRIKQMAEADAQNQTPEAIRADSALKVAQINAESREKEAQLSFKIAEMNQKTEILKLVQRDGVDMKRIEALLQAKQIDTDSKERTFAAEAAIEQENAREARASGQQPTGSGGFISRGTVKA